MGPTHYTIGGSAGFILGGVSVYNVFSSVLNGNPSVIIRKAKQKGDNIKEKKILQAKEKFLKLREDHNNEIKSRNAQVQSLEDNLKELDTSQAQAAKLLSQATGVTVEFTKGGPKEQILDNASVMAAQQTQEILEKARTCANEETKKIATQASCELRVMVESNQVNDEMAKQTSFNISQRIMNEMTYLGQVKVTVIHETRAVSVAK